MSKHLDQTPLLSNRGLSEQLGCDVWIKYEDCTPIRSFKARGGIYRLSTIGDDYAGVVTASTGNHGQGIALGAKLFGKRAVVAVPEDSNPLKLAAMEALGADVREIGRDIGESISAAREIATAEGLLFVEDGADRDVMLGAATLTLELLQQAPDLDDLIAPVGAGNLLGSCALVLRHAAPAVRLTGILPAGVPAVYESWKAGEYVESDRCDTFAGGLSANYPGSYSFEYWLDFVDEIVAIPDEAFLDAALVMLRETGHLPEGSGAAALAGLLRDPGRYAGRKVVILLTGNNAEQVIWDRVMNQKD